MNAVMFVSSDNAFRLNERVERIKDGSTIYECEADNIDELLEQINEIYDDVDQIKVLLPESDGRLEWEIGSAFPDKQIEYIPENFIRPLYEERLFEKLNYSDYPLGWTLIQAIKSKNGRKKVVIQGVPMDAKSLDQNDQKLNQQMATAIKPYVDSNGGLIAEKALADKNVMGILQQFLNYHLANYNNGKNNGVASSIMAAIKTLGLQVTGGLATTNGTNVAKAEQQGGLPAVQNPQNTQVSQVEQQQPPATTAQPGQEVAFVWPFIPPVKGCSQVVANYVNNVVTPAAQTLGTTLDQGIFAVQENQGWEASYVSAYALIKEVNPITSKLKFKIVEKAEAGTLGLNENTYLDILINKGYKALREDTTPEGVEFMVKDDTNPEEAQSLKEEVEDEGATNGTNVDVTEQAANQYKELMAQQNGAIQQVQNVAKQAVALYDECRKSIDPKDKELQKRALMLNQFKEKEKGYYQFASIVCSYILGELDPKVKQELVNMTKQNFKIGQPIDLSAIGGFFKGLFHSIYLGNIGKMVTDDLSAIVKDLRNSGFGLFIDGANAVLGTAGKLMRNGANAIGKKLDKASKNKGNDQGEDGSTQATTQQLSVNGYDAVYMSGKAEEFHKFMEWEGQPNFYKYNVDEPQKEEGDNNNEKTDGSGQSDSKPTDGNKEPAGEQPADDGQNKGNK